MAKEFNTTGKCIPGLHYMADVSGKFDAVKEMIDKGRYFIINRPRQYGKTTIIRQLEVLLEQSAEYRVISISFEGVGNMPFEDETVFVKKFLHWLAKNLKRSDATLAEWLLQYKFVSPDLEELSSVITEFVEKTQRKVVLFIDEVDKSSNNQLFLHFLGMLRDKYLDRDKSATFHSIVLAGVHDIKTLKLKLRPDEERKYNSPWNIAADFKVDMNLQPHEIKPMLEEYAHDKGVAVNAGHIADLLFYYTAGQPFLVSKLCKTFDEDLLPKKTDKTWTIEDVENAVDLLLPESNTNFDNITKELENNPELYQLTYAALLESEHFEYNLQDPIIAVGVIYGIFKDENGLKVHNRIYEEMIINYLVSKTKRKVLTGGYDTPSLFGLPDNQLDVARMLLSFQALMRAEYSKKDRDFLEKQGRLIFLAFLKPILNGHGHAFKEPQISEEKRLDVVISYHGHKYVAELKIWRGPKAHKAGLEQLADYLDRQGLDAGFLVIFDHSEAKEWKTQRSRVKGKRIFAVWV
jgi:AAA-like domain